MKEITFKNRKGTALVQQVSNTLPDKLMETVNAMERISRCNFVIKNPHQRRLVYVSKNTDLLGGKTAEEIKKLGHSDFQNLVAEKDRGLLQLFSTKGHEFFYARIPLIDRMKYTATADFHISNDAGGDQLINMTLTPLALTKTGEISLTLIKFQASSSGTVGNIRLLNEETRKGYFYDQYLDRWFTLEKEHLTAKERQILYMASRGFNLKRIGEALYISTHTVKFHRQKIFEKLAVGTIVAAVTKSYQLGLL